MSLDYRLGEIKDFETVCFDHEGDRTRIKGLTECLIFTTMAVDLGGIEEKNLDEWRWRLEFLQQIGKGNQLVQSSRDGSETVERTFTMEELRAHIGLKTNVIDTTRAVFVKRWVDSLKRNVDNAVRDAKRQQH